MSKAEELLNNLYVNISLINNETIRDKSFEDLETIRKDLKIAEFVKDYVNSTKTTLGWSYSKQLEFFSSLEKLVEETSEIEKELENEK